MAGPRLAAILAAALHTTGALAQADAPASAVQTPPEAALAPLELTPIAVAGDAEDPDAPRSAETVGVDRIRRAGPRGATGLLDEVAGADVVQDPTNPGIAVNVRGLQSRGRVTTMIDGARQNFQQAGHGTSALAYVDPNLLREVALDKSVSAEVGGAGALAGAVNFRTLDPDDLLAPGADWGAEGSAGTGDNGAYFDGMGALAFRPTERVSGLLAYSRHRLGAYDVGEAGVVRQSPTRVYDADSSVAFAGSTTRSALAKLVVEPTPDTALTLSYLDYKADFETSSTGVVDTQETASRTAAARFDWTPAGAGHELEALAWWNGVTNAQIRPARTSYDGFAVDYGLDTFGGSVTERMKIATPLGGLDLSFGLEGFSDATTTVALAETASDDPDGVWFSGANPEGDRQVGGAFARATLAPADWLRLRAGLRADAYALSGTASVHDGTGYADMPVDQDGMAVLPSFGASVLPAPGIELFADYSEGWRPATLPESVFGGSHIGFALYFAPNPHLKPERSQTFEAGISATREGLLTQDDRGRIKATVYHREIRDYISSETVYGDFGNGLQQYTGYVNVQGQANTQGLEVSGDYAFGRYDFGLSLEVIDTDLDGRYDARPWDGTTDLRPVTATITSPPPVRLSFTAQARFWDDRLTLGGRVLHTGGSADIYSGYELEQSTIFDAWASLRLNEHAQLTASVANITDQAYVDPLGSTAYPAPGRTFLLSLRMAF
ncbi:MAG: TonB-dependent receptor [Pseudomonadota bacterium]|nr:TonB-dependent receptor [Pseudomonadota bacterium]